MSVLIVGCGLKSRPGCVNLDKYRLLGVDVVHDLERFPYPFNSQEFDRIEASDVLEHVTNFIPVVNELGRVLKLGGQLFVRGPTPAVVWDDPDHKRAFTPRTFDGWVPGTVDYKEYRHYFQAGSRLALRKDSCDEVNNGYEYLFTRVT